MMTETSKESSMASKEVPLLEAISLNKSYGSVRALMDASFSIVKGEVHVLLGENGAGKSTLIKILCGVVRPDTGTLRLRGKDIHFQNPMEAEQNGIVAVFQELSVLPYLSVAENVFLGHEPRSKWGLIDFQKMNDWTAALFDELGMSIPTNVRVGDLSLADQQLVEIAKALSKNPDIIIFDEATSCLGKNEVELLFQLIRRLTEQGKTAIFISHRMSELEQIAHRATVFRDTRFIATFDWGTVTNDQIITWIAGRSLNETFPPKEDISGEKNVLEITNLSVNWVLHNITLAVKRGEILGLAGLQGHGQTDFLRVLFGAERYDSGEIRIHGKKVRFTSPAAAIRGGVALVPESRKTDGLMLSRSIKENMALMTLWKRQKLGLILLNKEKTAIDLMMDVLKVKSHDYEQEVSFLSGGNQQKVVIGKALLTEAKIMLLSDPTRGIDVGTKSEVYHLMKKLSGYGITQIFYSTEITELVGVCHRIAVFKQGQISALLEGNEINENNIIQAALGMA